MERQPVQTVLRCATSWNAKFLQGEMRSSSKQYNSLVVKTMPINYDDHVAEISE